MVATSEEARSERPAMGWVQGFKNFLIILDAGRVAIGALAVGLTQGCVDMCVAYAKERKQFGRPIADNQAIAFKLADMAMNADLSRLAVYRAVGAIGRNLIGTGAILVVVTGILLAVPYMQGGGNAAWLSGMMGFGILAALVGAFIVAPTAARLARLQVDARGELPEAFAALRKRQVIFGTVSGVLALLALLSVTVLR